MKKQKAKPKASLHPITRALMLYVGVPFAVVIVIGSIGSLGQKLADIRLPKPKQRTKQPTSVPYTPPSADSTTPSAPPPPPSAPPASAPAASTAPQNADPAPTPEDLQLALAVVEFSKGTDAKAESAKAVLATASQLCKGRHPEGSTQERNCLAAETAGLARAITAFSKAQSR